MNSHRRNAAVVILLVLAVVLASCRNETLFFNKHIENQIANYGTNLGFYESTDIYTTDSGESVLVSVKAFLERNHENDKCQLSFNFELSGFEAEETLKIRNAELHIGVEEGSLVSCEVYDRKKIGKNFYGEESQFSHRFADEISVGNQYLSAQFNLSGDPDLLGVLIEITYDISDAATSVKDNKITLMI